ncbi:MAG: RluA family pseudouridine synthase [Phycisphaerae bacterium]
MEEPQTVFELLVHMYPHAKKTTLREMVEHKRVRINGQPARSLKQPVKKSDRIEVTDVGAGGGAAAHHTVLAGGLQIVHVDSEIVVVDKPSGLLTATDSIEKRPYALKLLSNYFKKQNNKNQIHLIHRLDRDASGLLVFARTWDAFRSLKEQFFEHSITRRYDVIVHGTPKKREARLENLLLEDPKTGEVKITQDLRHGKLAILSYMLMKSHAKKNISHLKCELFTGRKHQIRVQLKANGHTVCGDPLYGKEAEPPNRLALHASHLTLHHPGTNRKVTFESPMPGSFSHMFLG